MRIILQTISGLLAAFWITTHAEPAPAAIPPSLIGHWVNIEATDTVGLILNSDKTCELYTNRLTSPKAQKACKYEHYKDSTYLIYLQGADGACHSAADFEFQFLQAQAKVVLDTGNGSHFDLAKKAQSELINTKTEKEGLPAILKSAVKTPAKPTVSH